LLASGLTQSEFVTQTGLSKGTISDIASLHYLSERELAMFEISCMRNTIKAIAKNSDSKALAIIQKILNDDSATLEELNEAINSTEARALIKARKEDASASIEQVREGLQIAKENKDKESAELAQYNASKSASQFLKEFESVLLLIDELEGAQECLAFLRQYDISNLVSYYNGDALALAIREQHSKLLSRQIVDPITGRPAGTEPAA
jgi:transcriptional regulator with XRE-family HTH domain